MKDCKQCKGTGQVPSVIKIPMWHLKTTQDTIEIVDFPGTNVGGHSDIEEYARAFHEYMNAHCHGEFNGELRRLYREDKF